VRLISWNCAGGFARKAHKVASLAPDVAVLAEVRKVDQFALGEEYQAVWFGDEGAKGVLVAARKPWALTCVAEADARHAIAFEASLREHSIGLIAVWSMPIGGNYVEAACAGLEAVLPAIGPFDRHIVAGDFNASVAFDTGRGPDRRFSRITSCMSARDLESLWHTSRKEAFGEETRPTYFHQWKREQPFHIDYMFACPSLRNQLRDLSIGEYDAWRTDGSDHMPLIADFDLARA